MAKIDREMSYSDEILERPKGAGRDPDMVTNPPHYTFGTIEVIEVIEDWGLGFMLGNAIKYIARAPHKGKSLEDLKKARWYLDREIARLERKR